jgi:hypothetical protein
LVKNLGKEYRGGYTVIANKLIVSLLLLLVPLTACAPLPETLGNRDTLFQTATLSALNV